MTNIIVVTGSEVAVVAVASVYGHVSTRCLVHNRHFAPRLAWQHCQVLESLKEKSFLKMQKETIGKISCFTVLKKTRRDTYKTRIPLFPDWKQQSNFSEKKNRIFSFGEISVRKNLKDCKK